MTKDKFITLTLDRELFIHANYKKENFDRTMFYILILIHCVLNKNSMRNIVLRKEKKTNLYNACSSDMIGMHMSIHSIDELQPEFFNKS